MGLAVKEKKKRQVLSWFCWALLLVWPGTADGMLPGWSGCVCTDDLGKSSESIWRLGSRVGKASVHGTSTEWSGLLVAFAGATLALCYWPVVGAARRHCVQVNPRQSEAGVKWNDAAFWVKMPQSHISFVPSGPDEAGGTAVFMLVS